MTLTCDKVSENASYATVAPATSTVFRTGTSKADASFRVWIPHSSFCHQFDSESADTGSEGIRRPCLRTPLGTPSRKNALTRVAQGCLSRKQSGLHSS